VTLDPVPVRVHSHTTIELRGHLLTGAARNPRLYVGQPGGSVSQAVRARAARAGWFLFEVAFEEEGRYDVELVADLSQGPETVVLLPIYADVEPDSESAAAVNPQNEAISPQPERDLLHLMNEARRRTGRSPLLRDPRLDKLARSHVRDMAENGFFGHVSPSRGSLEKRLGRAGLKPVRFTENVARSSSVYRIHQNLMKSPSHRISVLGREYTHVGIGMARSETLLIASEIFAKW
jgi:uncharacterized protein YkwD